MPERWTQTAFKSFPSPPLYYHHRLQPLSRGSVMCPPSIVDCRIGHDGRGCGIVIPNLIWWCPCLSAWRTSCSCVCYWHTMWEALCCNWQRSRLISVDPVRSSVAERHIHADWSWIDALHVDWDQYVSGEAGDEFHRSWFDRRHPQTTQPRPHSDSGLLPSSWLVKMKQGQWHWHGMHDK